ncbi:MAG: TIGR01777 family oxidoreductase [Actinomycetota bacterium]|nr:TIGR01777 family oxidoreductase [Actinomycetota bacterium]
MSGSTGFIGRALVARLRSEGHDVARLVRGDPGPGDAVLQPGSLTLDASRLDGGSLAGVDVVFHLAGEPITPWRWSAAKRERIRSSRVTTTASVARAIASSPPPRPVLVAMSAVGYYGSRGDELLDETSSAGSGTLADVCRAWEAASAPASEAGARVVNLRTGVVLGPGGGSLRLQAPLFRAGLGGRLGTGSQWTSWISLEDELGALLHVATDPSVEGPCNATAPRPVRNAELTRSLAALVGRPALAAVPEVALRVLAGAETTREVLLASQRVLPAVLERSGYAFVHPDLGEALAAALASGGGTPGPARR